MKTIEERAKEYSLKDFDGYYTGREKAMEEGYIAGAKEQKAIDDAKWLKIKASWEKEAQITHDDKANYQQGYHDAIEKACKWMKEQVYQEYGGGPIERLIPDTMIKEFMKNMEE